MIVQKPADLDPAMKSALKNHIMRKRQQLKQELEQDAIEKRLKREQEAKRKQDAMTLDQLKEQLSQLERTLDNLKMEKHHLFLQLKQNMRVLNEDDKQRKQKEDELTAARVQQTNNDPQNGPPPTSNSQQQPQQPIQSPVVQPLSNQQQPQLQQTHQPPLPQLQATHNQPHLNSSIQQQQSVLSLPQAIQLQQQQQPPPVQQQPLQHIQQQPISLHHNIGTNNMSIGSGCADGSTNNSTNHTSNNPPNRNSLQQSMKDTLSVTNLSNDNISPNKKNHNQPPPPSSQPSQLPTNLSNPYLGYPGLPPGLAGSIGGSQLQANLSNQNLIRTPPPPPNMTSLLNSAAFTHLLNAQNFPRQSAYLPQLTPSSRPSLPFGHHPMSPYPPLSHHHSIPTSNNGNNASSNLSISSGSSGPNSNNMNHAPGSSSHNNLLQSMKRPISATNLTSETLSPNKKLHTQQSTPSSQSHQLPANLTTHPYLAYPGLPPGLGASVGGPSLQASMFNQNLMRTPPPPSMTSLFNSAAFTHLMNAQNFPRQSPYLPGLGQPGRPPLPFNHPMNPYSQLGHHHGIPTSLSHASQNNPMIRPSPPPTSLQIPNSSSQLNINGHKLTNLPITSSGPLDFNPNLSTSTAHQIQQQASAVAAAAALGLQFGPPYFGRYP